MLARVASVIARLYTDESGATLVEYALIAALIAVTCAYAASQLAQSTSLTVTKEKNYFSQGH